jgi:hypothetical protein
MLFNIFVEKRKHDVFEKKILCSMLASEDVKLKALGHSTKQV